MSSSSLSRSSVLHAHSCSQRGDRGTEPTVNGLWLPAAWHVASAASSCRSRQRAAASGGGVPAALAARSSIDTSVAQHSVSIASEDRCVNTRVLSQVSAPVRSARSCLRRLLALHRHQRQRGPLQNISTSIDSRQSMRNVFLQQFEQQRPGALLTAGQCGPSAELVYPQTGCYHAQTYLVRACGLSRTIAPAWRCCAAA